LRTGIEVKEGVGLNPRTGVLRAALFVSSGDYPALSKMNAQQDAGAINGCMHCTLQGTYIPAINRVVYRTGRSLLPAG
jgi:hypothetical protein